MEFSAVYDDYSQEAKPLRSWRPVKMREGCTERLLIVYSEMELVIPVSTAHIVINLRLFSHDRLICDPSH